MLTKTALVGLAHFLLQADPQTAQNVMQQLPPEDSQAVMEVVAQPEELLPPLFEEKVLQNLGKRGTLSHPTNETSSGL